VPIDSGDRADHRTAENPTAPQRPVVVEKADEVAVPAQQKRIGNNFGMSSSSCYGHSHSAPFFVAAFDVDRP